MTKVSECCKGAFETDVHDGVEMHNCKTCGQACTVTEAQVVTQKAAPVSPELADLQKVLSTPYFRAYSHIIKDFVPFGMLTTTNEFFTKDPQGRGMKVDGVEVDFFLGRFCENGDPIYENDIVEIATLNEFGSAFMDKGAVRFDPEHLCYYIESGNMKDRDMPLPTKIVRVIGHNHA